MYNNFSNSISISISTDFKERIISLENNTFLWEYTISISNNSDKYIRILSAEFSFVNEFGTSNQVEIHKFNGNNTLIAPGTKAQRSGIIQSRNNSSIVFGKIFAFNELDREFSITIPTFSLDSPYYFYKTVQ